ncbi:NUDIX domain-containing protein [Candidatus Woesearchaeota archaeon]|nr:MAG: NUDIX domain-containing protein [Candidatus Woesearchaeota archaeon]
MEITHETERKILLKLIHAPSLSFNELWSKDGESNTFAYHLGKLESNGLVAKNKDGLYQLTEEGRKLSAFIEGDTGKRAEFPNFSHVLLVQNGDKWLTQKRLKEPFFGYWGFVSGKINFGQNLFECATRDLLEEAGLHATEWTLRAIEQVKTYENGKLLHHHYLFHVSTDNVSGNLKEKTHKAEHAWLTLDEYRQKETFPSEKFFCHIIPSKRPLLIEAERYMENGKFTEYKTLSVKEL